MPDGGHKLPAVALLRELLEPHTGSSAEARAALLGVQGRGANSSAAKLHCVATLVSLGVDVPAGPPQEPTAGLLKEALRPLLQPGSQLPTLVMPAGHAAGALLGNMKAFDTLLAHHNARLAAGEPPLLCNLDVDAVPSPIGVHPRVALEQAPGFARLRTPPDALPQQDCREYL